MACESCGGDAGMGGTCNACGQNLNLDGYQYPCPTLCMTINEEIRACSERGIEISNELRNKEIK